MSKTKKIRLAALLVSCWLWLGVWLPIMLCLMVQQPQVIPTVLIAVNSVLILCFGLSWALLKLMFYIMEGP